MNSCKRDLKPQRCETFSMSVSISFFFVAVVSSVVNTVSPDGQGKSDYPPTRGNERFNVKLIVVSSGKIE